MPVKKFDSDLAARMRRAIQGVLFVPLPAQELAKAADSAAFEANIWFPVEAVIKDGREYLLWFPSWLAGKGYRIVGAWSETEKKWIYDGIKDLGQPTKFQELPPPPEASEAKRRSDSDAE